MNAQQKVSPVIDDDTIELELTPEQLDHLSQAAAQAAEPVAAARMPVVAVPEQVPAPFCPPQPVPTAAAPSRDRRWQPMAVVKIAAATSIYVAFAWWSASQLAARPQPPVTAAVHPAIIPGPAAPAAPPAPAVRFVNPFDKTEVFEFPAGTTAAESRDKVAQILLQRAQERQAQLERVKPVVNVRTASLYRPP
ncbi:MAG TPA: hypothetical protein VGV09_02775 [Steroidobacteraceae bacterium]|nr:hypothetical protein [Steroidobacteraceae bacterium]